MRMLKSGILVCYIFVTCWAWSGLPASELLQKCINYHDPDNHWPRLTQTLEIGETRPNGSERIVSLTLDLPGERLVYKTDENDTAIVKAVNSETCSASLNGRTTFTPEEEKKHRLTCASIKRLRNYYLYLYGLPMKLTDPGSHLASEAVETRFQDREVLALKITYDAAVGKDTWYFYVNPETFALTGCRFYHDEAKGDGEYIVFDGEYSLGSLRLPQTRRWYTNKDDRYLGTDTLRSHRDIAEE